MKENLKQITGWLKQRLIGCLWKQVEKRIIRWWEEQGYCEGVIALASYIMGFLFFGGLTAYLFRLSFTNTEIARNLILLGAALVGLYFINRRTKAAEQSAKAAKQSITIELYNNATQQIFSKDLSIRRAGILNLEQVAQSDRRELKKIARLLVSFIHTYAIKNLETVELKTEEDFNTYREQRLDIEAAVNALASIASKLKKQGQFRERYNEKKIHLCNLQDVDLRGLQLFEADLSEFNLAGADMSGSWLAGAKFMGANLFKLSRSRKIDAAKFSGAFMDSANFSDAYLDCVNFHRAHLAGANFSNAYLESASFAQANLTEANFHKAGLAHANFTRTRLNQANFSGAILEDIILEHADISGADFRDSTYLTQEQINEAFYWTKQEPPNLPDKLEPPPEENIPF